MAKNNLRCTLIVLSTLLLILPQSVKAKTSIWKVSKANSTVYIGGTIHLLPPTAFPLPPSFEKSFDTVSSIILEAEMPDNDPKAQAEMLQNMRYKDNEDLSDYISDDTRVTLSNYLKTIGLSFNQIRSFKPGFLSVMMLTMELQKAQLAGEGVDSYFAKKAKQKGKAIEYLESLDFQISLISAMGQGSEDEFILSAISQMDNFEKDFKKIVKAWREGDMNEIDRLIIAPLRLQDPKTYQTLMLERNKNWVPLIEQQIADSDIELILVGVGHLVGPDNVLALLEAKGYEINQM